MNQRQKIMLIITAINLALIFTFPPFDSYSIIGSSIPIFSGFHFAFGKAENETINSSVLFLEAAVVLINAGIAWLLMQSGKTVTRRKFNYQNATLVAMAVNLVVILLFPPFENHSSITHAILPSFQGFYFIFSAPREHVIVTAMLYIEVIFVLINGALLWLMFRDRTPVVLTTDEKLKLLRELQKNR